MTTNMLWKLPKDWKWRCLGDVSDVVSKGTTPTTLGIPFAETGVPFLRGEDVSGSAISPSSAKFFISPETHEMALARSQLKPGDLLMTIAGTLGRVGYVPDDAPMLNCNQAVAFVRLRPEVVDVRFACFACQHEGIISALVDLKKVATIGNLNLQQIREFSIPLPPLPEQQRIAAVLARADRLRRLRRYALDLGDGYLQSVFLRMFGDPVTNPMGWPVVKLSSIGQLDRGKSKNRPRNAPELYGGSHPFVQTGDVANATGYIRTYNQTYSELGLQQSKLWPKGTLCITIAANIAKTAILTFDACFPDSVVGFTPGEETNVEFIQEWFSFIQWFLEVTAPEVAQKNINLRILRGLDVPLPPLGAQQQFARIVHQFERLRAQQREAQRQAEHLFQTLLHQAFQGKL